MAKKAPTKPAPQMPTERDMTDPINLIVRNPVLRTGWQELPHLQIYSLPEGASPEQRPPRIIEHRSITGTVTFQEPRRGMLVEITDDPSMVFRSFPLWIGPLEPDNEHAGSIDWTLDVLQIHLSEDRWDAIAQAIARGHVQALRLTVATDALRRPGDPVLYIENNHIRGRVQSVLVDEGAPPPTTIPQPVPVPEQWSRWLREHPFVVPAVVVILAAAFVKLMSL